MTNLNSSAVDGSQDCLFAPISTTLQVLLRLVLRARVNVLFPFSLLLLSSIPVTRVYPIPDLFSSLRWETTVGL